MGCYMSNSITSDSIQKQYIFNIVPSLSVTVDIESNPYQLPLDCLFSMAARINKKRSFLFVSKVLGKHIPLDPHLGLLSGASLSLLLAQELGIEYSTELILQVMQGLKDPVLSKSIYEQLKAKPIQLSKPITFIGFAETATALGHSMFDMFEGEAQYIHTTRELMTEKVPLLAFEEEHSHAASHRCYAVNEQYFSGSEPIVLVDDEITTGKTVLNIICDIQAKFPRQTYYVASLLDWRSDDNVQRFKQLEEELNINIKVFSLLKGQMKEAGQADLGTMESMDVDERYNSIVEYIYLNNEFEWLEAASQDSLAQVHNAPFLRDTARFGIKSAEKARLDSAVERAAGLLLHKRSGKSLCLGTGEFMYVPMRIAAHMGENLAYHSTTRSPIYYPSPGAKQGICFISPEDGSVNNYVYNIFSEQYDDVFIFFERDLPRERFASLLQALQPKRIKKINLVICGPRVY